MKNYKSIICVVAAVCLLGTAAFCGCAPSGARF